MDIFESKLVSPMLMYEKGRPFDDPRYIYEEKIGGERCLAYLDSKGTRLICSRCSQITDKFPELQNLHRFVEAKCILDGELVVSAEKESLAAAFKKRVYLDNSMMVWLASKAMPAAFVAFDILYYLDRQITQFPLIARKKLLERVVSQNKRLALARFVEETGTAFFETAKARKLMGVVAKKKSAPYLMGEQSRDWIMIRNVQEDIFIVCGYVVKEGRLVCLALGKFNRMGKLVFRGFVPARLSSREAVIISRQSRYSKHPFVFDPPRLNAKVTWIRPRLVCTVGYVDIGPGGTLQGTEFGRLCMDKTACDTVDYGGLAYV